MHVRTWLAATAVAGALILGAAGCAANTPTESASSPATQQTTTTAEETASSTALKSGTYTATIDGKQVSYKAAYLVDGIDAVINGGTYESAASDEVVFLVVNGGSLTVNDATVDKSGDAGSNDGQRTQDVSDDYNFYGMNSAIVVVGEGSSATVDGAKINTTSSGSNAVVAVNASKAEVNDTDITTSAGSSRGLHATYGGTITGSDLTIETKGAHSATVATDRGGGTVTVTGTNTFNTAGDGSPLVYSTGAISVTGVSGTASVSEAVVVEGKNTATVIDSDVTSKGTHGVMIYQSMSGDAANGDAQGSLGKVTLTDSTITHTGSGSTLYFTNTTAQLDMKNTSITVGSGGLASAAEDKWGTSGSNGATVTMTVKGSKLKGAVSAGSSSQITITTSDEGSVTGTTSGDVKIS